jgi:type IV pilus assembly protein PilC
VAFFEGKKMSTFKVIGRDANGVKKEILCEADSIASASEKIRSEGVLVLNVSEVKDEEHSIPIWHPARFLRMSSFDIEIGLRQISSMLKSGVPLLEALRTAQEQARNVNGQKTWKDIHDRILSGSSLGDALDEKRKKFGDITVQLARVGEQTGELEFSLEKAAEHLEARRNLRTMVVNALIYPFIAVILAIGVSAFLVVSVIPKIAAFLQSGGASLPPITQSLIDISNWVISNGVYILLALASVVGGWLLVRISETGRELQDVFLLKLPVTGKVMRLSATALFARSIETMITSGVTLLDSLNVASKLMSNTRLRKRIITIYEETVNGRTFSNALKDAVEFMPMLHRMAAVGEMTGSLASNLGETARFYEMMLAILIRRFSVMIEPVIICITGIIVGYVYIAFFTAVFSMANAG